MGTAQPDQERHLTLPRVTMLASIERPLRTFLEADPDSHERGAVVFFRRFVFDSDGLASSDRFVAVDFVPFEESWVTSSSSRHLAYEMRHLRDAFRRCEEESLVFCFAHSHPVGPHTFSRQDEENERTLLEAITNRNGRDVAFLALLLCEGKWYARHRHGRAPTESGHVRHIAILSDRIELHDVRAETIQREDLSQEIWARQAAAFGRPFVAKLQSLRVGVIGCSGTGSPTITLLARSGTAELILIDADALEAPNLNRVRGATMRDVDENKAVIAKRFVESMGLGTSAVALQVYLDTSPEAIDALASCDVIFGCTDDQLGREAANAATYYYGLAYIDVGLGGRIDSADPEKPRLTHHYGRVSTVLPEFGDCLRCQRVVTEQGTRRDAVLREDPTLTEEQLKERYLAGGAESAPGVGPFTSAVADYGVATLYDLIQPFRRWPPQLLRDRFMVDFVTLDIHSTESTAEADCPYCGTRQLRLMSTSFRIGRPGLGRRRVDV
jgi:molybdopterin-synthase adenylyltransferase